MTSVEFTDVTKSFPGVVALRDVSFSIAPGSCHAICGENGAGKSTLGKILAGIYLPDEGELRLGGSPVRFHGPHEALVAGVAMVHQELAFCDNLSVAENLCLGTLPSRGTFVSRRVLHERARELLAAIGATMDTNRTMDSLSVAEQQLVQIATAVGRGAHVLIFDEPTSSLGESETLRLFALIDRLRARGVTMIYVSHRMPEIFRLCDHVTVLRDGRHVSTQPTSSLDEGRLVQLMIGRTLEQYFPDHVGTAAGDEQLRVRRFTRLGRFYDIDFGVRRGEVVGLAGLVGAGRSEIAQALFGLDAEARGEISVGGKPVSIRSARDAIALGIGFVPEDRKRQGLVLSLLARENATLPHLPSLSRLGWIRRRRERQLAREQFERLRVRATALDVRTDTLSGGNQQKIVMAKWLAARSDILILDEPTRGVDVGAKAELHAWIDRLASEGKAILLISSELPELLNLSTRILVLREGRLVGELPREQATQEALLRLMAGV
jgi:ABC-type sugar transport system ATPase subunit